jgi:hypothetical protein
MHGSKVDLVQSDWRRAHLWVLIALIALTGCGSDSSATASTPVVTEAVATSSSAAPTSTSSTVTISTSSTVTTVPDRVLFIGDSFSWFLDQFTDLAASMDPAAAVESEVIWISGAPLSLHWSNASTVDRVKAGGWSVVVLQEDIAQNWAIVENFPEYAGLFDEQIKASGAETVLYMHWPWSIQPVPTQEQIAKTIDATAGDLGATVAPVGLAWQRALSERPDLSLYGDDGIHANPYGIYLTLCVFYATLFERSPEGATYRMADAPRSGFGFTVAADWKLADDDAAFLQRIAWETATERGLNGG